MSSVRQKLTYKKRERLKTYTNDFILLHIKRQIKSKEKIYEDIRFIRLWKNYIK